MGTSSTEHYCMDSQRGAVRFELIALAPLDTAPHDRRRWLRHRRRHSPWLAMYAQRPLAPHLASTSQICVSPAQTTSSSTVAASTSASSRDKAIAKRKRNSTPLVGDSMDSMHEDSAPAKKKKASRACFHCQKAHLTCDDCMCSAL